MGARNGRIVSLKKMPPIIEEESWEAIRVTICDKFNKQQAGVFVAMHHLTCLGVYKDGEFILPYGENINPDHLRFLRVFDEEGECYAWRSDSSPGGTFRMRNRKDVEDPDGEYEAFEVRQLLWGTQMIDSPDSGEGWKLLREDRGIELLIHQELLPDGPKVYTNNRLWLVTRNYITYMDGIQAGYEDSRFVRIVDEGGWEDEKG